MKYDVDKLHPSTKKCFFELLSNLKDKDFSELLKDKRWNEECQTEEEKLFDIQLKIDGHEVCFDEFFKHLDKQFSEIYKMNKYDLVREVMNEKFYNLKEKLSDLEEKIDEHLEDEKWKSKNNT